MQTFNFDTTRPEPEEKNTEIANTVENSNDSKPTDFDKQTDFVVTGSLSQAYTDILNKTLASGKKAVASESLSQSTAIIKSIVANQPAKPVLVYTTKLSDLENDNLQAFDAVTLGLDSGLFSKCAVCIEQDGTKHGELSYALESYFIKRGITIYRDRDKMLNHLKANHV